MNLAACSALTVTAENRVWFRAIQPQHWPAALQTAQTARIPSRFSPATNAIPAFPILYLAEDQQVASFEAGALLGSPLPGRPYAPNPRQAWIILNVQVALQAVADLTVIVEQLKLDTTAQELTGDWYGNLQRTAQSSVNLPTGLAPTQLLGQALHRSPGLEGFRAISAKQPTHMNLVVFPDKLRTGSSVVFHDLATGNKHAIT